MVGLFIPSLEIEVEQREANKKPYFRASCLYQGKKSDSSDKFVIKKKDRLRYWFYVQLNSIISDLVYFFDFQIKSVKIVLTSTIFYQNFLNSGK